jgi:hypothetical protein
MYGAGRISHCSFLPGQQQFPKESVSLTMPSIHDLALQSGFIFEAQVERLGASTASAYPAAPETAVVRVSRIIRATPALAGYEGQRITVHLQAPVAVKEGDQAVFFTHGTHYGDGLVVAELGHARGVASGMAEQLNGAMQSSAAAEVMQRLGQAEVVVSGVASTPRRHEPPASEAGTSRRVSEHDPDWWVSTINIDTVEKGDQKTKTAEVFYPNSMDIAWYRAPKIKEGDRGVWLLHNRDVYGKAVPGLAVTHPVDFRPIQDLEYVRSLLR